ncbi:MAG: GlsB/YeaQ/YmgE family stress response membrane protein, partial [Gemmatimonadales bacterium]
TIRSGHGYQSSLRVVVLYPGRFMGIVTILIVGLIVGAIAKLLVPGRDPGGWIITILLGIAGAFVGTWLGRVLGMYRNGESAGWIASIIGAVLLLLIYRMVVRRRPVV